MQEKDHGIRIKEEAIAVKMNQLDFSTIDYLFTDFAHEHVPVLFELFFQFLCQLAHTDIIGQSSRIFAFAAANWVLSPLLLVSLMFDLECIIFLKGFVAPTR